MNTPAHKLLHAPAVAIIGAASCVGARDQRCDFGPQEVLRELKNKLSTRAGPIEWRGTLPLNAYEDHYDSIADLCARLALQVAAAMRAQQRFAVIGGDHSCAIGTWSGAAVAQRARGALGLIWVDAHMDAHTPASSPSGAIHGMPLACLLGHGDARLLSIGDAATKLHAAYVCVIGVRSYELAEAMLLKTMGVHVFSMQDIRRDGMKHTFESALNIVRAAPGGYGISIDLDAIDPVDAPGVGSPEPGGIPAQQLLDALASARDDAALHGIEVAELNPFRDRGNKTATLAVDLLSALL